MADQPLTEYEWRKRGAARLAIKNGLANITPVSQVTWREWWETRFNDDLLRYYREVTRKGRANGHRKGVGVPE